MNKEIRIEKISEIMKLTPISSKQLMWKGSLTFFQVYEVPLKYLIYNKYNGRILSRTKSLETQGGKIDTESEIGKKQIEDLLWDSKKDRNSKTLSDIEKFGQKEYGIITKDGIIIDGNRRAMLLNKIPKYDYFKTVILDVTLEENPLEIQKLETTYQMGEDEKLGYNAIEKYLKSKELQLQGVEIDQIADWMGETKGTIENYLSIMKTMDEYLDYLGYKGLYTQLDEREDQFITLNGWLDTYYDTESTKGFSNYKNSDVDDLKQISFDYIRAKYEGKSFRNIATGQKQNHFFGNEKIWESFRNVHFEKITPILDEEDKINYDSLNLNKTLNDRDYKYECNAIPILRENLENHNNKLGNQQHKDEPIKLINKALDAVNVAKSNKNYSNSDVIQKIEQLNNLTDGMLQNHSLSSIFKKVLDLLTSVKIEKVSPANKDELLDYIKEVQRTAYQLEKDIK